MTLTLLCFVWYYMKDGINQVYVLDSVYTEYIKEKNKSLSGLNTVNRINTWVAGGMGIVSLIASLLQFRYVYKHNDFRNN